jgi:fumarate reductase subunit C
MFSIKQYLPKIKNYFRRNPETLFIVGFQVLLLVCACLLISGNSFWAEGIAVVAYFSLVIGVVLQLISFLRHREGELEDNEL